MISDHDSTSVITEEPAETGYSDDVHFRYADELRALGQVLEVRRVVSVELEATEDGYKIEAQLDESKQPVQSFGTILKQFFCGVASFPRSNRQSTNRTVELRYSARDLQHLIQDGIARRQSTDSTPDPFSMSHILRSVGAYLDGLNHAVLIRVAVQNRWITVGYRDHSGSIKELKHDIQFYYDFWVKMYLHRSDRPAPLNPTDPTYTTR